MITNLLTFLTTVINTPRTNDDDKGQGTLEYVGIVVIAALLVTAIFAAVNGADIGGVITTKLSEITGIGG